MSMLPMPQPEIDPVTGLPMRAPWMTPPIVPNPTMGMPAPQHSAGGLLGRVSGAFGGSQGLLNLGANLMAASGPSDQRVSFGQALGSSLLANQQFQRQQGNDALQAMLLKTKLQPKKPKLQEDYEYAKSQGFKGGLEDWKRVASAQQQSPAAIQEFEYFQKLPPAQREQFVRLQRQPTVPQVVMVNGVPTLVDRIGGTQTPLSTIDTEAAGKGTIAGAEAQAKARGSIVGEAQGGIEKKAAAAQNVNDLLDVAEPLIDLSTGSKIGAGADKVAAMFGKSLDGAQAAAQLQILQAALMFAQPRMEGPQGVLDVQLYEKAAGQIGDPTVPNATKLAAVKVMRALQVKYRQAAERLDGASPASAKKFTSPGGATVEILD